MEEVLRTVSRSSPSHRGWAARAVHATPLIVSLTLGIPRVIFTEAGLSFLGLGVTGESIRS